MQASNPGSFLQRMVRELLLASGQFALFYILMNFSQSGMLFWNNAGHVALLGFLLVQTVILVLFGKNPAIRFLGSLIAPFIYTLMEGREGWDFILNAAHIWFWIFSAATGAFQAFILTTKSQRARIALEFILTATNVGCFLLLYFYFDTTRTVQDIIASQAMKSAPNLQSELTIQAIGAWFPVFLSDPTHIYILLGGSLLAVSIGLGRADTLRLKERINALFGQYVDQDIRDRIIAGSEAKSQNADLCILFADIRNFTGLSEANDAQAITGMLNTYFSRWTATIRKHGGIVDKFIGDAVMAIFGLEHAGSRNAVSGTASACDNAVDCFAEMRESIPELRAELSGKGFPAIADFGVGIHFGTTVIGDIGSDERKNFTVIGDAVNVASRLESACKTIKTPCVISEAVFSRLGTENQRRFNALGRIGLKGKTESLRVFGIKPAAPGSP